jgi:hypothetical protein
MTTMQRGLTIALLGALSALGGCTNDRALTTTTSAFVGPFHQLDSMGRPLVVEIYAPWADHDAIFRNSPAGDTGTLTTDIAAFVTAAGRSSAIVTYDQQLLAGGANNPTAGNVIIADLSQTGPANYLGVETTGKSSPTGSLFGGRSLPDDVVDIDLGLAYGNLATLYGGIADDGKEQNGLNGTPNLASDNVTASGRQYQIGAPYAPPNFPYLENPL